jgi:branched-chain amino acid transport system permease protein
MTPPAMWFRIGAAMAVLCVIGLAPFTLNAFWLFVLAQAAVQAITVLSAVVLYRVTGAFTLCQASLVGIGAYLAAWLATGPGLPVLMALVIAPVLTATVGVVIAFPALRLRNIELSILTLMVTLALSGLVFSSTAPFRVGRVGASLPSNTVFGVSLTSGRAAYVFAVSVAALVFLGTGVLLAGRFGRVSRAVASGNAPAAAGGIDITRHKVIGFALSAFLAAVAGVVLITIYTSVDASAFGVLPSVQTVVLATMFGMNARAAATGGLVLGLGAEVPGEFGLQNEWITAVLGFALVALVLQSKLDGPSRV